MKKALITFFLIFIVSINTDAQLIDTVQIREDKKALARVEVKEAEFLHKNLTEVGAPESQITKFKQITKEHIQKLKDVNKNASLSAKSKYDKVMQHMKEKEDKEREVLGREKYNDYLRVATINRQIEQMSN